MNRSISIVVIVGMLAVSAQGATITFSPAADFSNVSQLDTSYSVLVEAANIGTGAVDVTTANGITFVGGTSVSLNIQNETDYTLSTVYDAATHKVGYTSITGLTGAEADQLLDPLQFGAGAGSWGATWTGLTPTQDYLFQLLIVDDRGTNTIYVANTTDWNGPYDISKNAVQLITGTFTADAATQGFRIAIGGSNNVQLNAYQLRTIPEPATMGLLVLGGLVGLKRRR